MCDSKFIFSWIIFYLFCFERILNVDLWINRIRISIFSQFLFSFLSGHVGGSVWHSNVLDIRLFFVVLAHQTWVFTTKVPSNLLFFSHQSILWYHRQISRDIVNIVRFYNQSIVIIIFIIFLIWIVVLSFLIWIVVLAFLIWIEVLEILVVLFFVNERFSTLLSNIVLVNHFWFRIYRSHFASFSFVSLTS